MRGKNNGVSLVYVLIVLSVITVFSVSFIYFIKQKTETAFIKNKSETDVAKEYLLFLEEENAKKIAAKNPYFGMLDYFDSVKVESGDGTEFQKLIFFNGSAESVGNFKIKKVSDSEGKEYALPLEKNEVYRNLEVTYAKDVLGKELLFKEEVKFNRVDSTTVEISVDRKN